MNTTIIYTRRCLEAVDVLAPPNSLYIFNVELWPEDAPVILHSTLVSLDLGTTLYFADRKRKQPTKGYAPAKQVFWERALNLKKLKRISIYYSHIFLPMFANIYRAPILSALREIHLWQCLVRSPELMLLTKSVSVSSQVDTISMGFTNPVDSRQSSVVITAANFVDALLLRGRFSSVTLFSSWFDEYLCVASLFRRAEDHEMNSLKRLRLDNIQTRWALSRSLSECSRTFITQKLVVGNAFSNVYSISEKKYLSQFAHFDQHGSREATFPPKKSLYS